MGLRNRRLLRLPERTDGILSHIPTHQGGVIMEDKELLEKIIAKQSVIIPAMEKTGETKDIPEKLRHAMAAAEEWADVIEKKEGRDKEARRWPVKQFAEEAHEHIALFDHETRQQIQEYCELVARLPYDDDAPLGV